MSRIQTSLGCAGFLMMSLLLAPSAGAAPQDADPFGYNLEHMEFPEVPALNVKRRPSKQRRHAKRHAAPKDVENVNDNYPEWSRRDGIPGDVRSVMRESLERAQ
jgi:hypothetical protein